MSEQVGFYEGDLYGLSNFSAHEVVYEGVLYATAEHAYQVAKFSDSAQREKIRSATSAFLAREYGQSPFGRTENFDKVGVMKAIMRAKLQQHVDVQEMLRKTGDAEILKNHPGDEGYWGTGPDGRGANVMGKIWMELHAELRGQIIFREPLTDFKPKFTCAAVFVEAGDRILLLERQDHKTEPGRWGHPAGKVESGERVADAARRELFEETGIAVNSEDLQFRCNAYVRYPEYDFIFAMYGVKMPAAPPVTIKSDEHKSFVWVTMPEAHGMDLVTGTHDCLNIYYSI